MTQKEFIAKIEDLYAQHLPFVVYRKPEATEVSLLFQEDDSLLFTEDFQERGFVFAPFDWDKKAILLSGSPEVFTLEAQSDEMPVTSTVTWQTENPQVHIDLVNRAVAQIQKADLQKVVLSRKQNISIPQTSPVGLFLALNKKYTTAFTYLWHHPKVGTWLGATPETLLALNGRSLETMALAGTQSFEGTLDVNWGKKEQEEQQLVTDEIVNKLKPFDFKSFRVHDRETYRAGNLLHLRTKISGGLNLEKDTLKALLSALHPTPAVCGLPRDLAKSFIEMEEPYDREFYTGFLGEINMLTDASKARSRRNVENLAYKTLKATSSLYVNLRCMQFKPNLATLYVGGGITEASNAEAEWEETVNKAQTIASIL